MEGTGGSEDENIEANLFQAIPNKWVAARFL